MSSGTDFHFDEYLLNRALPGSAQGAATWTSSRGSACRCSRTTTSRTAGTRSLCSVSRAAICPFRRTPGTCSCRDGIGMGFDVTSIAGSAIFCCMAALGQRESAAWPELEGIARVCEILDHARMGSSRPEDVDARLGELGTELVPSLLEVLERGCLRLTRARPRLACPWTNPCIRWWSNTLLPGGVALSCPS